ncbi:uncharacterized protein ISCGN_020909 [Ixodes scapularis]
MFKRGRVDRVPPKAQKTLKVAAKLRRINGFLRKKAGSPCGTDCESSGDELVTKSRMREVIRENRSLKKRLSEKELMVQRLTNAMLQKLETVEPCRCGQGASSSKASGVTAFGEAYLVKPIHCVQFREDGSASQQPECLVDARHRMLLSEDDLVQLGDACESRCLESGVSTDPEPRRGHLRLRCKVLGDLRGQRCQQEPRRRRTTCVSSPSPPQPHLEWYKPLPSLTKGRILVRQGPPERRGVDPLRPLKPSCLEVGEFLLAPLKSPRNLVSRRGRRPVRISLRQPPVNQWTRVVEVRRGQTPLKFGVPTFGLRWYHRQAERYG